MQRIRHYLKTGTAIVADETGPVIWTIIVRLRWLIAIAILAAIFFTGGEEVLLGWFDFNLEILRLLRDIPVVGGKVEVFLRFFNVERWMVIGEIGLPLLIVGWARRRLRVRVCRHGHDTWDRHFWLFCRHFLFPRRRNVEV
ncbi:hypothetical protein C4556_00145 [Candidatus Parcubacteria bacterium]|nr:MAG: hypothetical protein C4556_00145 [Candidatus Parcubacteria bacterium]